jgi:hypothetical protein
VLEALDLTRRLTARITFDTDPEAHGAARHWWRDRSNGLRCYGAEYDSFEGAVRAAMSHLHGVEQRPA